MGKIYEQLSEEERCVIYRLHADGKSRRYIGRQVGRNSSTISRELARNALPKAGYQPVSAHRMAGVRRRRGSKIGRSSLLRQTIVDQLAMGRSPEIIAGRLERDQGIPVVSHESIYRFIYSREARREKLHRYLRKGKARRGWRAGKDRKAGRIPDRISIHERAPEIDDRSVFGHWEGDLMGFSDQQTPLLVLHERTSRLTLLARLPDKKADSVVEATEILLTNLPPEARKSITYDNGGEFAGHRKIAEKLSLDTYFCDPYASWQKGGVENAIGRLRPDLPRKIPLQNYSDADIHDILLNYNDTPRKCLGFLSPFEAFINSTVALQM